MRLAFALLAHHVDLGIDRVGRYRGVTGPPAKSQRQPPTRRRAKSQDVADLAIGARAGPRHHRGTANA
jgi:hypothetical protein